MSGSAGKDAGGETRGERLQRILLRVVAGILFTGLPGALLPRVAFEKLAWLVGEKQPPLTSLIIYVSGNAGYAYSVLGVLVWMMSRDVRRHSVLIRALGWLLVLGGPGYWSIDVQSGLPVWWTCIDSLGCVAMGCGLLPGGLRRQPWKAEG